MRHGATVRIGGQSLWLWVRRGRVFVVIMSFVVVVVLVVLVVLELPFFGDGGRRCRPGCS